MNIKEVSLKIKESIDLKEFLLNHNICRDHGNMNHECLLHKSENKNDFSIINDGNDFFCHGCKAHGDVISAMAYYKGYINSPSNLKGEVFMKSLYDCCKYAKIPISDEDSDKFAKRLAELEIKREFLQDVYDFSKSLPLDIKEYIQNKRRFNADESFEEFYKLKYFDKECFDKIKKKHGKKADPLYSMVTRILHFHFDYYGKNIIYITGEASPITDKEMPKYVKLKSDLSLNGNAEPYGLNYIKEYDSDYIVISEGYWDHLSLISSGIPSLTFGTCKISKYFLEEYSIYLKNFKRIYVLFDAENNKSGEKGAISLMRALCKQNIKNSYFVDLSSKSINGREKIDIEEYLREISDKETRKSTITKLLEEYSEVFFNVIIKDSLFVKGSFDNYIKIEEFFKDNAEYLEERDFRILESIYLTHSPKGCKTEVKELWREVLKEYHVNNEKVLKERQEFKCIEEARIRDELKTKSLQEDYINNLLKTDFPFLHKTVVDKKTKDVSNVIKGLDKTYIARIFVKRYDPLIVGEDSDKNLINLYYNSDKKVFSSGVKNILKKDVQRILDENTFVYKNPKQYTSFFTATIINEIWEEITRISEHMNDTSEFNNERVLNPEIIIIKDGFFDINKKSLIEDKQIKFLDRDVMEVSYNNFSEDYTFIDLYKYVMKDETEYFKLQEYMGYCLSYRDNFRRHGLIYSDKTGTGKNTLLNIFNMVTNQVLKVHLSDLSQGDKKQAQWQLENSKVAWIDELSEKSVNVSTDEATGLKTLAGETLIQSNRKFKDQYSFKKTFKLIVTTNHMPICPPTVNAYYNKFIIMEMKDEKNLVEKFFFEKAKEDIVLAKKLQNDFFKSMQDKQENKNLFFKWCLEGYQRLLANGDFSGDNTEETNELRMKLSTPIGRFVRDRLETNTDTFTSTHDLWDSYKLYSAEYGDEVEANISNTRFAKAITFFLGKVHWGFTNGCVDRVRGYRCKIK